MPLDWSNTDGIVGEGGTILGSSRTNPFKREGAIISIIENFRHYDLDGFIAIGGDDTLGVANKLYKEKGFPIVGVPKTIDNDLSATDFTFGFDTAVNRAVEAMDSLKTTARSHRRIMVVEIMGRHAGWITAFAGIGAGADVVLVPERPFSIEAVAETLRKNRARGKNYNFVAVAEGATLAEGEAFVTQTADKDEFGHVRLGGIAEELAKELQKRTGYEARHVVLGHLQRGGSPSAYDRILGTRLGLKAYETVVSGNFGKMVALRGNQVVAVSLEEGVGALKLLSEEYMRIIDAFTL
jgi:6-phosphofructokinase 1